LDEVTEKLLFGIVQDRNIPDQLLTAVIKIYENNEINMKLDATLTQPVKINKGFRKGRQISPTLFNIHINQIIIEWKERR
jgi:hypothetical protein